MTVLEAIQRSTEFLARKGVASTRLTAELLLAEVLGISRMKLYLEFERRLSEDETNRYREFIRRRGQREPVQQIVGSTSFCGLEIAVNRSVLVPRPETEVLAELGWTLLAKCAFPAALDLGTGSGCIAIAVAAHCPAARLEAVDISAEALDLARQNALRHGLAERISFVQGDGLGLLPPSASFDLILSNPPYIPSAEIDRLEPEVKDYEPRLALDGGADGLDFFRRLASQAARFLRPGGKVMAEFGDGQAEAVRSLFHAQNWIVERIVHDYTQRSRIVIAQRPD